MLNEENSRQFTASKITLLASCDLRTASIRVLQPIANKSSQRSYGLLKRGSAQATNQDIAQLQAEDGLVTRLRPGRGSDHSSNIRPASRNLSSHAAPRWREMDSNHRFPVSGETLERPAIGSPAIIFRENSWPSTIAARNTAEARTRCGFPQVPAPSFAADLWEEIRTGPRKAHHPADWYGGRPDCRWHARHVLHAQTAVVAHVARCRSARRSPSLRWCQATFWGHQTISSRLHSASLVQP
jgi:hypothetical protein